MRRDYATDLAPLFARASVFVSCQRHENLGSSSLLEAMASGDAVVATDVGQTWRIVDERVGAPRRALTRGPGRRGHRRHAGRSAGDGRPGSGARERVLAGYGPGPYVARLLSVYEQAAQRRAGAII